MDNTNNRVRVDERQLKGVRFSPRLIQRINEARRTRGQTFQTYVQLAVGRKLEADEAEDRAQPADHGKRATRTPSHGLGIRERLESQSVEPYEDDLEPAAPTPPTPTVTVQVQSSSSAPSSSVEIAALARMVIATPRDQRKQVLENACRTLAQSARTKDEALHLAELLDAEIKRLDTTAPTTALERVRARMKR